MLPDLSLGELALRLAVAAGLAGAIGLERELRDRAAGLRTHMLVGAGAALFTVVSAYGFGDFLGGGGPGYDPTRIAAQIVSGIGFLGAGAIIRHRLSVRGLTTAAGLWVAAAIGMASGAGYFEAALVATGIVLVGLGPLRWLEHRAVRGAQAGLAAARIDLRPGAAAARVLELLSEAGAKASRIELEEEEEEGRRRLRVEVELPPGTRAAGLVDRLAALDEVVGVRLDT